MRTAQQKQKLRQTTSLHQPGMALLRYEPLRTWILGMPYADDDICTLIAIADYLFACRPTFPPLLPASNCPSSVMLGHRRVHCEWPMEALHGPQM